MKISFISFILLLVLGILGGCTDSGNITQPNSVSLTELKGSRSIPEIITIWEHQYLLEVIKTVDQEISEEKILAFPNGDFFAIYNYVRSLKEKGVPDHLLPIIVCPDGRYASFRTLMKADSNKIINWVMPYYTGGVAYPQNMNFLATDTTVIVSVSGGNVNRSLDQNEWVTGNMLDFLDSTDIQYIENNNQPIREFLVFNIKTPSIQGASMFKTPMSYFGALGFPIRVNLKTLNGSDSLNFKKMRMFKIYPSSDSMLVDPVLSPSFNGGSGTAYCLYMSGAVAVVAAKLNRIRRTLVAKGLPCTFQLAQVFARQTASHPIRNNLVGYGLINVSQAIDFGKHYFSN